jgi:hypothetical protein
MSQERNSPVSFEAGEDLEQYRRVCLTGGKVYYADDAEYGIGTTLKKVAAGSHVSVRDYRHGGSHRMVASGAVLVSKRTYAAADGKVAATGTLVIGTAVEGASGNGSVFEVWPHPGLTVQSSSSSSAG